MDYNQFSYYRANPYYRQGYMPPIAHLNRKAPDFFTQIPQGEKHLHQSGRKHFNELKFKNNIQQQGILVSPEKYPFQNRIAMDKSYLRSLNTIDIQGASSNTLKSQAVRNKIKAQQQLRRKNSDGLNGSYDQYRLFQKGQEQKRRELAMQQYERNKKLSTLIQARDKYRPDQETQMYAAHRRNNSMPPKQNQQKLIQNKNIQHKRLQQNVRENSEQLLQQNNQRQYESNNNYAPQQEKYQEFNPQKYYGHADKQTRQVGNNLQQYSRQRPQNMAEYYYKNSDEIADKKNLAQRYQDEQAPTKIYRTIDNNNQYSNIKRNWTPRRMQKRLSISGPVPKDFVPSYSNLDKKQHRKYNPTNISELGQSFNITARNIIGN